MQNNFIIENKKIGDENPCFLIAEIGSNHNRDKNTVFKLIDASADAGFDAVKFQIYDAKEAFSSKETTKDVGLDHLYGDKPWWEVARDTILMPRDWFGEMFEYIRKKGMIPLSAIHRPEDCEFLMNYNLPAIKIASIDFTYYQLLEKLIKFNLPMIISSGMADSKEIENTVNFLIEKKQNNFALLHCVSCYPPKAKDLNLNNIINFKNKFNVPIGYSDHFSEKSSAVTAVSLGANIIEKHITLDKKYPGPDHHFAIEPAEMKQMVEEIRNVELMLGQKDRVLSKTEFSNRKMIRRSIIAKKNINKGEAITLDNIKFSRPGTGIQTFEFHLIENKKASKNISAETIIKLEMVDE